MECLIVCRIAKIKYRAPKINTHAFSAHGLEKTAGRLLAYSEATTYKHHMGIINDDTCRKCRIVGMRETLEHIHCLCPTLSRTRLGYLGTSQFKRLDEQSELVIKSL